MRVLNETLVYNALDAAVTYQCRNGFFNELDDGYRETYNHTIDLYDPLMYMMIRGVRVDHDELKKVKIKVEQSLDRLTGEITEACGRWVNPLSPKDCCAYFYIEQGIPPYTKYNKKTQKSSITCDDKALQRIARGTAARKPRREASLIQNFRRLSKLKGTYLDITFDADARMRCQYSPRGTKFGRLSSGITIFGTGMNMQNLPPPFKSFLIADEGCVFMDFDKAKAEWVIVAYDSGDEGMINAIEQGLDVHAYTASQMFKVPIDIVKSEHKVLEHDSDPFTIETKRDRMEWLNPYRQYWMPRTMSMRQCGKKSNHGLNYDETYKRFAIENEITEKEAGVIIEFYHRTYPGVRRWHSRIQSRLGQDRVLVSCWGRRCRFLDKWGDELFKAAYSYNPQSTVAELINRGIVKIYRSAENSLRNIELLGQVHDNILTQAPDKNPKELALAAHTIVDYLNPTLSASGRDFTISTDLKLGYNWGQLVDVKLVENVDEQTTLIRKALNGLKEAK